MSDARRPSGPDHDPDRDAAPVARRERLRLLLRSPDLPHRLLPLSASG